MALQYTAAEQAADIKRWKSDQGATVSRSLRETQERRQAQLDDQEFEPLGTLFGFTGSGELTPGHVAEHETIRLAARAGVAIECSRCQTTAAELGETVVQVATNIVRTLTDAGTDYTPEPIVRNRGIYPEIPAGWREWWLERLTRDDDNRAVLSFLERWIANPTGSVVISGENGVGKSTAIAAVANELQAHKADISPWSWGHWADVCRNAYRQDVEDDAPEQFRRRMERCGVLIIDDVAAEHTSRTVEQMFDAVIDARWSRSLATLISTNAGGAQWRDWSARAYSRLMDNQRGVWLTLTGEDRRRVAA